MSTQVHIIDRIGGTKSELKQLRAKGMIPAVVYGNAIGSISVAVDAKEIKAVFRSNPHAILEVLLPTHGKQSVMIHQSQKDPMNGNLLHIDFHQINMNQKMNSKVTLHYTGTAEGVQEGGMLQVMEHEVEIGCMPYNLPSHIDVDVSKLAIGGQLLASDLKLTADLELASDPSLLLVTVLAVQNVDEEVEADAELKADERTAADSEHEYKEA